MSTSTRYIILLGVWLLTGTTALAQTTYAVGLLPAVNFNYKLPKNWSVNLKVESRQELQRGTFAEGRTQGYEYVLTDPTIIAARKVGLNTRIAGGYLLRFRGNQRVHRFIQQYTVTQRLSGYRLSHRLVTDQTFAVSTAAAYRLRYRLATELPLSGQAADAKEFYLKISNEYLNSLEAEAYDLEVRVIPLLGYAISQKHKIEAGIDYRVNSFVSAAASHRFWTSVNWYIEI